MDRALRIAGTDEPTVGLRLAHVARLLREAGDLAGVRRIAVERGPDELTLLARAVTDGEADAALCEGSLLPAHLPQGLVPVAVLRHADERYRWVVEERRPAPGPAAIGPGGRVAVPDPIARVQLAHRHPRLLVGVEEPSLATLRAVARGTRDGACVPAEVAAAGLPRELVAFEEAVADLLAPAGRGMLVVLVAGRSDSAAERLRILHDPEAAATLHVARSFLRNVSDVPHSLATARVVFRRGRVEVVGLLAADDARWLVTDAAGAPANFGTLVAEDLADSCKELATRGHAGPVLPDELAVAVAGPPAGRHAPRPDHGAGDPPPAERPCSNSRLRAGSVARGVGDGGPSPSRRRRTRSSSWPSSSAPS